MTWKKLPLTSIPSASVGGAPRSVENAVVDFVVATRPSKLRL